MNPIFGHQKHWAPPSPHHSSHSSFPLRSPNFANYNEAVKVAHSAIFRRELSRVQPRLYDCRSHRCPSTGEAFGPRDHQTSPFRFPLSQEPSASSGQFPLCRYHQDLFPQVSPTAGPRRAQVPRSAGLPPPTTLHIHDVTPGLVFGKVWRKHHETCVSFVTI